MLFRSGIDLIIRLASYSALETAPLSLHSATVTPTWRVSHTGGTMCGGWEWQVNHTRHADKRCVHLTHQTGAYRTSAGSVLQKVLVTLSG